MKPTPKQIVYGVVLAGASTLLISQVLSGRYSKKPPPTIDRAALDPGDGSAYVETAAEGSAAVAGESDAASTEPAPAAELVVSIDGAPAPAELDVPPLEPEHDPANALERLEASLAGLHNMAPAARRPNLDRLARGWAKPRLEPAATDDATPTMVAFQPQPQPAEAAESESTDSAGSGDEAPTGDALVAFLGESPLSGIVWSATNSAAMFGGRIVRPGDQLLPGDAIVKVVERRSVLVTYGGRDMRIELPPFRPRPRADTGSSTGSASDTEASGAAASTAASGAPEGASTDAAAGETQKTDGTTETSDATNKEP